MKSKLDESIHMPVCAYVYIHVYSFCLSVCINMFVHTYTYTLQVTISTREATPRAERERDPVLIGFPMGAAAQRAGPSTVHSHQARGPADESRGLPRSDSSPRGHAMHAVDRAPDSPLLQPLPPPEATADAGGREGHEDRRMLQQPQDLHRDGHGGDAVSDGAAARGDVGGGGGDAGSSSDGRSQAEQMDVSGVATRSSAGRSVDLSVADTETARCHPTPGAKLPAKPPPHPSDVGGAGRGEGGGHDGAGLPAPKRDSLTSPGAWALEDGVGGGAGE